MKEILIKSEITICFVFAGKHVYKFLEEKLDEEEGIILEMDNKNRTIDISDEEFHNDGIWKYDYKNNCLLA